MLYFKVLPTDPRFQALTQFQKMILYNAVVTERDNLFSVIGATIQSIISIFVPSDSTGESNNTKVRELPRNSEFDRIRLEGNATGKMSTKSAIYKAYHELQKHKEESKNKEESTRVRPHVVEKDTK